MLYISFAQKGTYSEWMVSSLVLSTTKITTVLGPEGVPSYHQPKGFTNRSLTHENNSRTCFFCSTSLALLWNPAINILLIIWETNPFYGHCLYIGNVLSLSTLVVLQVCILWWQNFEFATKHGYFGNLKYSFVYNCGLNVSVKSVVKQ